MPKNADFDALDVVTQEHDTDTFSTRPGADIKKAIRQAMEYLKDKVKENPDIRVVLIHKSDQDEARLEIEPDARFPEIFEDFAGQVGGVKNLLRAGKSAEKPDGKGRKRREKPELERVAVRAFVGTGFDNIEFGRDYEGKDGAKKTILVPPGGVDLGDAFSGAVQYRKDHPDESVVMRWTINKTHHDVPIPPNLRASDLMIAHARSLTYSGPEKPEKEVDGDGEDNLESEGSDKPVKKRGRRASFGGRG